MERLGISSEVYEYLADYIEYERWAARQRILYCVTHGEIEKANSFLKEYYETNDMTKDLEYQFYLGIYAQIRRLRGAERKELFQIFSQAVSLTVKEWENPLQGKALAIQELNLLLESEYYRNEACINRYIEIGCDIDIEKLTETEKELFLALKESNLFIEGEARQNKRAAYIHITSRCNMRCAGCYSQIEHCDEPDLLTTDDWKRIIDNIADAGIQSVIISGGEPFLRDDLLELIEYMKIQRNISRVDCITNGLAEYEKYVTAGKMLDCLSFPLDGYEEAGTASLDAQNAKDIEGELLKMQDLTVLTITHHLENEEQYNRIFAMEDGCVKELVKKGAQ